MRTIDLKTVNLLTGMYLELKKLLDESFNAEFYSLKLDKEVYDNICKIHGLILETLDLLYNR